MTKTVLTAEKCQNGAGLSGSLAELCTVFPGQNLGFPAHRLELSAAYSDSWLRVLRSGKRAIFKHAAAAQRACDYLVSASEAALGEQAA